MKQKTNLILGWNRSRIEIKSQGSLSLCCSFISPIYLRGFEYPRTVVPALSLHAILQLKLQLKNHLSKAEKESNVLRKIIVRKYRKWIKVLIHLESFLFGKKMRRYTDHFNHGCFMSYLVFLALIYRINASARILGLSYFLLILENWSGVQC